MTLLIAGLWALSVALVAYAGYKTGYKDGEIEESANAWNDGYDYGRVVGRTEAAKKAAPAMKAKKATKAKGAK